MTREPVFAGSFYPGDSDELRQMLAQFLKEAGQVEVEGEVVGIIAPHAGYIYSGPVAAYCYKALEGKTFDTVIVLAPSHRVYFKGASVYMGDYKTPLGVVKTDKALAEYLTSKSDFIRDYPSAHAEEHSLEVQVPFLQTVLGDFKMVPIVIGEYDEKFLDEMSGILFEARQKKKILLVASSDMSHYHPYKAACEMDKATLALIESGSIEGLMGEDRYELCGKGPVLVLMSIAQKLRLGEPRVLKYANSGDTAGDKSRVVGYSAVTFVGKDAPTGPQKSEASEAKKGDDSYQKALLQAARKTIETYLKEGRKPKLEFADERLNAPCGAFVTLRKKGDLRGCIGLVVSDEPLCKVVQDMAIASACNDYRFSPVSLEELRDIEIEISVLSPPKKIESIDELELGKHGIIIKQGGRSGLFLPQVATETVWSKEEFLSHCARDKAGLAPDAWKKGAEIYTFTAEVFSEQTTYGTK